MYAVKHPAPQELLAYQEERLDPEAANRLREHLAICDWCLDDIEENLTEKLRADLNALNDLDNKDPDDFITKELRLGNDRLADEPFYRKRTREMLSSHGANDVLGPQLHLLEDFDERLARLKTERR